MPASVARAGVGALSANPAAVTGLDSPQTAGGQLGARRWGRTGHDI